MASEESSLNDFEYRVVGIPVLEGRIYNQESHAKSAIIQAFKYQTMVDVASVRERDLEKHIQIRHVLRGEWKGNIREVFGLE